MITVIVLLIAVPFAILFDVLKIARMLALWSQRRRAVPLQQRNMKRATAGAFVLVGCATLALHGFPVGGWKVTAGIAALALLYLVVGVRGSQGSRFDVMSVFYWAALVIGCVALLGYIEGFPL